MFQAFGVSWGEKAWDTRSKLCAPHVLALSHDHPGARTHDTPGPINPTSQSTPTIRCRFMRQVPRGFERSKGGTSTFALALLICYTVVSRTPIAKEDRVTPGKTGPCRVSQAKDGREGAMCKHPCARRPSRTTGHDEVAPPRGTMKTQRHFNPSITEPTASRWNHRDFRYRANECLGDIRTGVGNFHECGLPPLFTRRMLKERSNPFFIYLETSLGQLGTATH